MPIAEIETPSGQIMELEVPEGATNDEIKAFAQSQFKADSIEPQESIGRTALDQSLQGATFGFADEITDRIGALIASGFTDESYDDLLAEARGMSKERLERQFEQNPATSILANMAGGVLTGGALSVPKALSGTAATAGVRGAINAIPKAGQAMAGSIASGTRGVRAAKTAGAAATGGALFGAGSAQEGERLSGAGAGALIGGTTGVLAPIAIKGLTGGAKKIADIVTRRASVKSGELAPVDRAIKSVAKRLRREFPDDKEYVRQLNRYASRQGYSLLEEGGADVRALGEAATLFPSAQRTAGDFFEVKIGMAPENMQRVITRTMSPDVNYFDALDDIMRVGRAKAKPLYKQAFQGNQQVDSPMLRRILNTDEGQSALKEAVRNMRNEMALVSKPDKVLNEIARDLNMAEKGGIGRGLKLQTWDYVKRAMDKTQMTAIKQGDDSQSARIGNLVRGLRDELDSLDKTGAYAKARAVSGDYLETREAMEMGKKFLSSEKDLIERAWRDFTPTQKQAFKVGASKSIRNRLVNIADSNDVARLFRIPNNRQKLELVLGKKQYNKFMKQANETIDLFKLRNQMSGNSKTVMRQIAAADEFGDQGAELAQEIAIKGIHNTALNRVSKYLAQKVSGLSDSAAGEVAEILYETNPQKKAAIVKKLFNEMKSNSPRKLEATKKLEAFYGFSDKIKNARIGTAAQVAALAAVRSR